MTTIDYSNYDFLAGAVENQEYERSTWHTDQRHFARSERRVITVYKRDMDDSHDVTLFALENVIALIVSREHSFRFGVYKQWEADFLRHLLGHTTFEEEHSYNEACNRNISLCSDHSSIECRIGKKLTALLRHDSPLKKHMYSNGAVELRHVLECCNPDVNPYDKFNVGRLFAAFIQGNNKQRYFIEVALNDDWFLGSSKLPWKIFIGCNQGHTTGFVRAVENSHQLTMIELSCLGWFSCDRSEVREFYFPAWFEAFWSWYFAFHVWQRQWNWLHSKGARNKATSSLWNIQILHFEDNHVVERWLWFVFDFKWCCFVLWWHSLQIFWDRWWVPILGISFCKSNHWTWPTTWDQDWHLAPQHDSQRKVRGILAIRRDIPVLGKWPDCWVESSPFTFSKEKNNSVGIHGPRSSWEVPEVAQQLSKWQKKSRSLWWYAVWTTKLTNKWGR